MNIEDIALIQIKSLDEILEDVDMSRAGHRDVINDVEIIKKALDEMKILRTERDELLKHKNKSSVEKDK